MWYEFGNFRLDATRRLLVQRQDGATVPLASKAIDTLVHLVEHRAEIVEKTELMSAVWPNVVVEENNLNQIISVLRKTLGESPGENRFIVTHPGRGYRFVAPVKTVTDIESGESSHVESPTASSRQDLRSTESNVPVVAPAARKTIGVLTFVLGVVVVATIAGAWFWRDGNREREHRRAALANIADLLSKDQYGAAFTEALPLTKGTQSSMAERNDELGELWRQIVLPMRPLVTEAGATVYFKSYADAKGEWVKAGVSPFDKAVDAPRGPLRLKIEKSGFRTGYFVITNPGPSLQDDPPGTIFATYPIEKIPLPLVATGALSDEWVQVPQTSLPATMVGGPESISYVIPAFAIARSEVTNHEFKEFVDAGGYDTESYWQGLTFKENGKTLSYTEARKRFVDATNRPGPAGWQLSTYPSGQAAFPVGGISWYEAMAYARFRGQALPTLYHWVRAAVTSYGGYFNSGPAIASSSRFSADGPVPARDEIGVGPWGTVNMFGNVREWVSNFSGDNALVLGGSWSDYTGLYQNPYPSQPMQRQLQFGLRLMRTLPGAEISKELLQPIPLAIDSPDKPSPKREPVSNDAFAAMRFQYPATRARPVAQTVEVVKENELWAAEEVVLKYANAETTTLYVVRPKTHRSKLQPIVFGPPSDCCLVKRSNRDILDQMQLAGLVVASGRALVLPIWAGSYERKSPVDPDPKAIRDLQRRAALRWHQDVSTTLDYLETRDDMDVERIGFFGFSFGANSLAPIALAIDGRIKAAVLASGGVVLTSPPHPMIDIINYAPRISIPVLMLNGRFDPLFPLKESQQRLFNLLGTPANQKMHIVYDVGHLEFPPNTLARDTTAWFDRYLGEVR